MVVHNRWDKVELLMANKGIKRVAFTIAAVVVAGLAAFICYGYRRDTARARARVSSGSRIVNTPCGLIEYADVGKGSPILVIHGAGGGFDQGLDFGRPLIDKGFRVIAMSRFGYLRTPLPADASPMVQADAHACLLDALNLLRVVVLGGSAGAPSAMQLCLRHPERCSAMVLGVPIAFLPRPAGERKQLPSALAQLVMGLTLRSDFVFWLISKLAPDTMEAVILATPPTDLRNAPSDEQERVLQTLRNILPVSQRQKGLWNDAAIATSIPRYELERFRVPTLVISAEDDLFGTYESGRYTAEHIRGARFVGYATGGHLLVGHQREVWSDVAGFLKGLPDEKNSTAQ
jgi:pimeloyl-ACP methyl ester carboxylesterase